MDTDMESEEYPMMSRGPLSDVRGSFTPQTSDLRGSLPNPAFTMITSLDNGQVLDATTNQLMGPSFGNDCC